jgi:hypothetical protein
MQIDESDEQQKNADCPIDESFEPDSNVIVERDSHSQKHNVQNFSTDEGIQIDESDEQFQNADSSIDESFEPDSNVTVERDSHREKHSWRIFSTDEGMQIRWISVFPFSPTLPVRYSTSIRTPSNEIKLRGKTHPEHPEQSRNGFLASAQLARLNHNCPGLKKWPVSTKTVGAIVLDGLPM